MGTEEKQKEMSERVQPPSMNLSSIFNNPKAFEDENPEPVDIPTPDTASDDKATKGKRKRNGDGKETDSEESDNRSPSAKRTPSFSNKSSIAPKPASSSSAGFARASLAKTDLLSTPKKASRAAVDRTPPPPPSKNKSGRKGGVGDETDFKTTCRRCAENGYTCKPHTRDAERYRCNKCIGDKVKAGDCVMIDAAEAAAIASGVASDMTESEAEETEQASTTTEPGKEEEATPSPVQTPTPAPKSSLLGPPLTPGTTPGQVLSRRPPRITTTTPTPDDPTTCAPLSPIANSSPEEQQHQSKEIEAYRDKYSKSTDHDLRAMSQLLWATHLELRQEVQRVQQAERRYNDLLRIQRDFVKVLKEFIGVPRVKDVLENAMQDNEKDGNESEQREEECLG